MLTTMMTPRFVVAEFAIDSNQFAQAYYHTDAIGSVRALTDATGATVARYDYAPFGEDSQPLTGNPIRFTGQELDSESGHYYYGARYYRNIWGRFATVDPLLNAAGAVADPQLWNRYAYVLNNPLALVDPTGMEACDWDGAALVCDADPVEIDPPFSRNITQPLQLVLNVASIATEGAGLLPVASALDGVSWLVSALEGDGYGMGMSAAGMVTGVGNSANVAKAAVALKATKNTFRKMLAKATGGAVEGAHAHHIFPKKFIDQFGQVGIDVHSPQFGAWWNATEHLRKSSEYNLKWERFLAGSPSHADVIDFGRNISKFYHLKVMF